MKMCDRKNCEARATHRAEIVIFAISERTHTPAIGTMPICVCTEHATEENARELLQPEGKRQIDEGFLKAGKARPDWGKSFARWVKL